MGGQQSKKRDQTLELLNEYNLQRKDNISEKEFTQQIFKRLDNNASHTTAGPILVTQTYLLKAFYDYLKDQKRGFVPKNKVIDTIEKIYDKPEKAIEYSLRIIASDRERITKNDFSVFMEKSLEKGIESIIKRNTYDRIFQKSLKDWLALNKAKLMSGINDVFTENAKYSSEYWTLGDFKRWILEKDHWTIYIEIRNVIYKIPLNIPCLFGVRVDKRSDQ